MPRRKELIQPTEMRRRYRIADYWLVDRGKAINDPCRKQIMRETEKYAEVLLAQLGFQYVLPLNKTIRVANGRNHHLRSTFPFDFYCEKDGQKWFIDVTAYIVKLLPRTPLWGRLGLKIGVLFIRRDLQKYCFKEGGIKSCVSLRLKDIGLESSDRSEARRLAWRNRRISGNASGWTKGLTKETDERMARNANARRIPRRKKIP